MKNSFFRIAIVALASSFLANAFATPPVAPAAGAGGLSAAPYIVNSSCARPEYPKYSKESEEEGTATSEFVIDADGTIVSGRTVKSSGSRSLDNAALKGLSLCKFVPGSVNGKPVLAKTWVAYQFRLEDYLTK